jgi:BA14K-like protein
MTSRFAPKAAAIGTLFLIATAAQAQRLHDESYYDPAYATHFGFAPDYNSGPYAYDDSYGYDSNSGYMAVEGASYCAQHDRSYNPTTGTYLGYDGQRHPCS